eukprot:GCRY01003049.1.p1 GENE.GCRY01003049.1~~GCRY01003049.1.p1  ORF type:complete len:494 (+),score=103.56 GCRY01003049.1:79-1560(+)
MSNMEGVVKKDSDSEFSSESKDAVYNALSSAIQCQTLSLDSSTNDEKKKPFIQLHQNLKNIFPTVYEKVLVADDFFYIFGWNCHISSPGVICHAHLDVVSVSTKTEEDWKHPAFSGKITDDRVWGRGSLDNKASSVLWLQTWNLLIEEGFEPTIPMYLVLTHDEEIGGQNGSKRVNEWFEENKVQIDSLFDEGLIFGKGLFPGVKETTALIALAEKGRVVVDVRLKPRQGGHASMPPYHSPITDLADAVKRIRKNPMKPHPTIGAHLLASAFVPTAPSSSMGSRFLKGILYQMVFCFAFALFYLFSEIFRKKLPKVYSLLATTIAPISLECSSTCSNVIPSSGVVSCDCRIHPGDSIEVLVAHLEKTVNRTKGEKFTVTVDQSDAREPVGATPHTTAQYRAVAAAAVAAYPGALPVPALMVAGTDTYNYRHLAKNIFRFLPFALTQEEIDTIHGVNESVRKEELVRGLVYYRTLLKDFAGGSSSSSAAEKKSV